MDSMLTGKAKEDFEKYLLDNDICCVKFAEGEYTILFYDFSDSMQFGVIVDFFDTKGIYVMDKHNEIARKFYYDISTKPMSNDITSKCIYSREEARKAAIEQANKIYNER